MKVLLCTSVSGVVAIHALLFAACGAALAEETDANVAAAPSVYEKSKPTGVLVLQDGGVLEGQVEQVGDRFKVIRGGSEVELSASRVMFTCGSMHEAYERRVQQIAQPTADAHFEVFEWCLRYGLLDEAANEIDAARKIDPGHPRLPSVDRRLSYARDRKNRPAPAPQPKPQPQETADEKPSKPTLPIESLPRPAVERFTRKVQPILVNNCTAGGCHQMGGEHPFKLDRALLHGLANRRSTMHNLSATLALVDRDQPHLSPLLVVPRATHGGMKDPVFGQNDEAEFRHIMEWVALVTNTKPPGDAETTSGDDETAATTAEDGAPSYTNLEDPISDAAQEESLFNSPRVLQVGAQATKWEPRDEFDPEIFNRQTKSRSSTAAVSPTAAGANLGGTP